ncbi:MAG: zinc ribbon domain-containing protein [Butyrivibrio sp.]|nr:zinc ribbon domain-containing protein [Butyrivibrio sp.]
MKAKIHISIIRVLILSSFVLLVLISQNISACAIDRDNCSAMELKSTDTELPDSFMGRDEYLYRSQDEAALALFTLGTEGKQISVSTGSYGKIAGEREANKLSKAIPTGIIGVLSGVITGIFIGVVLGMVYGGFIGKNKRSSQNDGSYEGMQPGSDIMNGHKTYCTKCGNSTNPGDRFCIKCGQALSLQAGQATTSATYTRQAKEELDNVAASGTSAPEAETETVFAAGASSVEASQGQTQSGGKMTTKESSAAASRVSPALMPGQRFFPVQGAVKKLRSEQIAEQASVPYDPSRTSFVFPKPKIHASNMPSPSFGKLVSSDPANTTEKADENSADTIDPPSGDN